ncbi:MAG: hypothetical protein ACQGVC_03980 [Myxococcota bacterium]
MSRSFVPRSLFAGALVASLLLSGSAAAEPLAYLSRPDRSDVALIDLARRVVLGGVPVVDEPRAVAVSPDGRSVWIGNHETRHLTRLRTFDARTTTLPALAGATDVVFHDDLDVAYVALDSRDVVEVDAATGAWLRDLPIPNARELVFLPGAASQSGGTPDQLAGLTDHAIVFVDLSTGSSPFSLPIGSNPASIGRLGDRLVVAQGRSVELIRSIDTGGGASVQTVELAGDAVALAADEAAERLYLATSNGRIQPVCASCAPAVAETPIDVSSLDFVSDLALSSDGSELYVVGRRSLGFIDTATSTFEEEIAVRAGGGQLGRIAVADALPPCHPRSTSILAARSEVQDYATSGNTKFRLRARLQDVRQSLLADDPAQAHKDLRSLVGTVDWRAGLDPTHANHLPAADAERLLCAIGHFKTRITAACTADPTCDHL